MKITDIKGLGVEPLTPQQPEKVGTPQEQAPTGKSSGEVDVIHLSSTSRLRQKASEVAYQTPEVRPEKVAALKDSVQQGTYEVDSQKVANSLIAGVILEK